MYRQITTFFVIIIFSFYGECQIEIAEISNLKYKNIEELHFQADSSGNIFYYYKCTPIYNLGIITEKRTENLLLAVQTEYFPKILGTIYDEDNFFMYYWGDSEIRNTYISCYTVNKKSGITTNTSGTHLYLNSSDKYVTHFIADNKFFVITLNKSQNKLYLLKFGKGTEFERFSFTWIVPIPLIEMKKIDFGYISNSEINKLAQSVNKNKIFCSDGNTIYLTAEQINKTTKKPLTLVVKLDLKTNELSYINIEQKIENYNTYIFEDKLFNIYSNDTCLNLSVFSMDTLNLIKDFSYSYKDSIGLKCSPLFYRYVETAFDKTIVTTSVNEFETINKSTYNELNKYSVLIHVSRINNKTLNICIGSYKIIYNYYYGYGTELRDDVVINEFGLYFESYLDENNYSIINNVEYKNIQRKIDEYRHSINFNGLETVFANNNNYYISYFDKENRVIKTIQIE
ncbi:MAG: hypothetical protein A2W91_09885 [Bacteroidetes bacterium GWF2_38_335]|nr:MAG: hypothetical protein A2W91_09885 [Bacteroidetes bacterium GWF2_38_335]HBS88063.1 hypothetical protein [Bacteroidales bacterium]